MQESTLEATVRAAQRGDGLALSALLDELMPYVGQICGVVALDRGEDAAQEALIAILRNIHRLREPAALFGWARTIATREAVRVARQSQRERPDPNLGDRAASAAGAELSVELLDGLAHLEPEQRAVIVLRELEGLSERETAQLLGIATGTVKSRLHRARARFRKGWGT